jgi:hypothetical protein
MKALNILLQIIGWLILTTLFTYLVVSGITLTAVHYGISGFQLLGIMVVIILAAMFLISRR